MDDEKIIKLPGNNVPGLPPWHTRHINPPGGHSLSPGRGSYPPDRDQSPGETAPQGPPPFPAPQTGSSAPLPPLRGLQPKQEVRPAGQEMSPLSSLVPAT